MKSKPKHDQRIRVLLVDDHPILRGGLRALIQTEPDMVVVGELGDGLTIGDALNSLSPDVIVMDVAMPSVGGEDATARVKALAADVKVLALSAHDEAVNVRSMLAAGASGYLLKRSAPGDLVRAVRAVAAGEIYLDPPIAGHAMADRAPGKPRGSGSLLSEREIEVLQLLAEGYGVKETAAKLAISPRTLETYRARAVEKLGLRSRAEIVRYALRQGWLKSD